MKPIAAHRPGEAGQALIIFVLAAIALLGIVAMVVDVGMVMVEKRRLQNAADAAALAAAQELPNASADTLVARAQEWAAKNGYDSGSGATVTVQTPYNGDPGKVEVTISKDVPAIFGSVLGFDVFDAEARAVATRGLQQVRQFAVLVLNPTACDAFAKGGSGAFTVTGGGAIAVNSDCATAINVSGSGDVSAAAIFYYARGGWTSNGRLDPSPLPMPQRAPDPLAGLPEPSLSALGISQDSGGTAANPQLLNLSSGDFTLHPGVYYGGISISSQANVHFEPGIYAMAGGGFNLSGGGLVEGNGVMFYNTSDPDAVNGNGACESIHLSGGADASFTPPADGIYKDILFFQDRSCTAAFTHVGNGQVTTGIYYLPAAQFRLTGTSDTGGKQVIADTVDVSGNADVSVQSSPYLTDVYAPLRLIE